MAPRLDVQAPELFYLDSFPVRSRVLQGEWAPGGPDFPGVVRSHLELVDAGVYPLTEGPPDGTTVKNERLPTQYGAGFIRRGGHIKSSTRSL